MIAHAAATSVAVAEILLLAIGGFVLYRRRGASVAESCAFGALLPWVTLSLLYQVLFIIGLPSPAGLLEAAVTLAALGLTVRERKTLRRGASAFRHFSSERPLAAGILFFLLIFLAARALVQSAPPVEQAVLDRLLAQQSSAVGSSFGSLAALCADPPAGPPLWNPAIVGLRFSSGGTGSGINLPGFFAYLAIVFGTYALARRYAWPATAFAVSVMVASMPRLVLLSASPGLELLPAAAILFALLSLFRTVESPNAVDLGSFLVAAAFGISPAWMSRVAAALLLPLGAVVLFRRHGGAIWLGILRQRRLLIGGALAAVLVFSQLWWPAFDRGTATGPVAKTAVAFNPDGIQGAGANLLRYLLQSLHIPPPIDRLCRWAFSFEPTGMIEALYFRLAEPVLNNIGAAGDFRLAATLDRSTVWFGPLGGLVVLPAVLFCVRRAPRRLKAVAVMLTSYFFLTSLILAWTPQNAGQFTLFFICGGFCAAYFLPPWHFGPRARGLLLGFSLALLAYCSAAGTPALLAQARSLLPP